jgi:hypothetical protein
VGEAQAGAHEEPPCFGAQTGPTGQWELTLLAVAPGGVLQAALVIPNQNLSCRDVVHAVRMSVDADRFGPLFR